MIRHATATTRLCARRTVVSQKWQMPLATFNRPAPTLNNFGQQSPVIAEAIVFHSQTRLLRTSTNYRNVPKENIQLPGHQQSYVAAKAEDLLTKVDEIPQYNPATDNETIYAKSTGSDASAIAVIRISGPACTQVIQSLALC